MNGGDLLTQLYKTAYFIVTTSQSLLSQWRTPYIHIQIMEVSGGMLYYVFVLAYPDWLQELSIKNGNLTQPFHWSTRL